jgi:8-oxo-dGTP diphosphatase
MKDLIVPRVGCVVILNNSVLLVRHKSKGGDYWVLPGGGIEFEESISDCAEREVLEETTVLVKCGKLLFISEWIPKDGKNHVVNIIMEGAYLSGTPKAGSDPDQNAQSIVEAEWMPLNKLASITLYPEFLKTEIKDKIRTI